DDDGRRGGGHQGVRVTGAPPLVARGLVKRYGELVAVDHVDLSVERGDVFGYLGPNGAGKTTSLRMLLGLIRPTEGYAELFGLDPAGMRDMRRLVRRLAGEGITIMLSSHLLYEVEELCNRVAIVRRGRVVYEGSLAELKAGGATSYGLRAVDLDTARRVAQSVAGIGDIVVDGGELRFTAGDDAVAMLTVAL